GRNVADGAVALDEEDGLVDVADEGLQEGGLPESRARRPLEDEVDVADLRGGEGVHLQGATGDRRGDRPSLLLPDVDHRLREDGGLLDRLAELHALTQADRRLPALVFSVEGGGV